MNTVERILTYCGIWFAFFVTLSCLHADYPYIPALLLAGVVYVIVELRK